MSNTIEDIEKLVAKAAKEALMLEDEHDRLAALKILAPYYTLMRKLGPPEEDTSETMADFAEAMQGDRNGSAAEMDTGNHRRSRPRNPFSRDA